MDSLQNFIKQTDHLNAIISLVDKIGRFKGKRINRNQWGVLYKNNKTKAENLLYSLLSEAYTELAAQFPNRDVLFKEKKVKEIHKIQEVPKTEYVEVVKEGKPGKDAPQIDEIRSELEKLVAEIKLPEPTFQPTQVKEITKVVHEKLDINIDTEITRSRMAVRDALELIEEDQEKLSQTAVRGLTDKFTAIDQTVNEISELANKAITKANNWYGGGIGYYQAEEMISKAIAAIPKTWEYYVTNWTTEPVLLESITGGDVYSYTLDGTTRYRFVPSTYDATQDAFYTSYSSPTLSGLIVTRG
jgi:hypothetical protein